MSAQRKPDLPQNLRDEIARIHSAGFSILPLGGGNDGKRPILKDWGKKTLSLPLVFGPMYGRTSQAYGIRLEGYAVLDLDERSEALCDDLQDRFGECAVMVQTPRGMHLYYRLNGPAPNLRGEGLPVDVKTGATSYVMGPLSVRPDGGTYEPFKGVLGETPLSALHIANTHTQDKQPAPHLLSHDKVLEGNRHERMKFEARAMVELVQTRAELETNLLWYRDEVFENPASFRDTEVISLANWAWNLRMNNMLFHGRDSGFWFHRTALESLIKSGNYTDSVGLYVRLADQHSHNIGKTFSLHHGGMKSAGHTDLSRERFKGAVNTLWSQGLLRIAKHHSAGRQSRQYQLQSPKAINQVATL